MAAANGAVYSYSETEIKTIGNEPAKGICGTGLIDIIAVLLINKKIDKANCIKTKPKPAFFVAILSSQNNVVHVFL